MRMMLLAAVVLACAGCGKPEPTSTDPAQVPMTRFGPVPSPPPQVNDTEWPGGKIQGDGTERRPFRRNRNP